MEVQENRDVRPKRPRTVIISDTDSGEESENDLHYKRGPRRRKHVTEISRVTAIRSNEGVFVRHENAVLVSEIEVPCPVPHPSVYSPFLPGKNNNNNDNNNSTNNNSNNNNNSYNNENDSDNDGDNDGNDNSDDDLDDLMGVVVTYPIPPSANVADRPAHSRHQAPSSRGHSRLIEPPPRDEMIRMYERKTINVAYTQLTGAHECEYAEILRKLSSRDFSITSGRFYGVLEHLRANKKRKSMQYAVARAMLAMCPVEARILVFSFFEQGLLGNNRLHIAAELHFFYLSPWIILGGIFDSGYDLEDVRKAVSNFPPAAVGRIAKFVAKNSRNPAKILEEMKRADCFQKFDVNIARVIWKEERVRDLIACICETAGIPTPSEFESLRLRIATRKLLDDYELGGTEIQDFFQLCVIITEDDDRLFRECYEIVAESSNPLAKFIADVRGYPFSVSPRASSFLPSCRTNPALHRLATGRLSVINSRAVAEEFTHSLSRARHYAIVVRGSPVSNPPRAEHIVFRLRDTAFLYSRHLSRPHLSKVALALARHGMDKRVFTFDEEEVKDALELEFSWVPNSAVDARRLATENGIFDDLAEITRAVVGGDHCCRARNVPSTTVPSLVALNHLDIEASLLYEFCIQFLHLRGAEISDSTEEDNRRARERQENRQPKGSGRSRSRKR